MYCSSLTTIGTIQRTGIRNTIPSLAGLSTLTSLPSSNERKQSHPRSLMWPPALISAAKNLDADTVAKLATIPAETYRDLISAARGDHLRSLVLSALEFRRIGNASEDMRRVVTLMEEALRMVGRKSRLNGLRLRKYGVSVDDDGPQPASPASTSA
jgi:hypothetical protein